MQIIKSLAGLVAVVMLVTGLILLTILAAVPEIAHASTVDAATGTVMLILMVWIYFIPWMVALIRKVKSIGGIVAVNLFLGWTLIGWVGALAWAAAAEKEEY